jgi:DnaK suppressor protein
MTTQQRNKIQTAIEEALLETHTDIKTLKDLTKPISPENAIGRVSRMDAINNKSVNEAALRSSINKLALLQSAIVRVHEENFGICMRCGQEIPFKRILLIPQSNRCVHCAGR